MRIDDIPIFVERRGKKGRLQVLRRIVNEILSDWKAGDVRLSTAAEIFAFHGLPLGRALELLAGRKSV